MENNRTLRYTLLVIGCILAVLFMGGEFVIYEGNDISTFFSGHISFSCLVSKIILVLGALAVGKHRFEPIALGLGGLFSLAYLMGLSYLHYNSLICFNYSYMQMGLAFMMWLTYTFVFYVMITITYIGMDRVKMKQDDRPIFAISMVCILLGWGVWMVLNYPASFNVDAIWQIDQFMNNTYSNHHPVLGTLIMKACYMLGTWRSPNLGIFIYQVVQALYGSLVISYGLKLLQKRGVPFRILLIFCLVFAFTPVWGCFAQWYEKDMMYAITFTLMILLSMELLDEYDNKKMAVLVLVCLIASLLRKSGIYEIVPLLVGFTCRKRKAGIGLIAFLVVYFVISNVVYPTMGVSPGSSKEMYSIPFQQTARYVKYHSGEVTQEEKEGIGTVLDYYWVTQLYDPRISDPIKDVCYKADNPGMGTYWKTWFSMFLKHPGTYISATLNNNYGFIAPVKGDIGPGIDAEFTDERLYRYGIVCAKDKDVIAKLEGIKQWSMEFNPIKYICMPGWYTWLLFMVCGYAFRKKKYNILFLTIPLWMSGLVCIASPLSNEMRYILPVVMSLPYIYGYAISVRDI